MTNSPAAAPHPVPSLHDGPIPTAPRGPGRPTPPISLGRDSDGGRVSRHGPGVTVPTTFVDDLRAAGIEVTTGADAVADASRDWWPLAMTWAADGVVAGLAGALAHPRSTDEVAAIAAACNLARIPLTVAGGRSGVCGGSVPLAGGLLVDLTAMNSVRAVDSVSGLVDVEAGAFGDVVEDLLRTEHGVTIGHWPQSMALATVGGWAACRGAGQLSTRYGKIEDMVAGLEVVLADGTIVRTGGVPRAAVGPDLTQLFVGSEGTLGVITAVTLRTHPVAPRHLRVAVTVDSAEAGFAAMRRIVQRGARPAVMRWYDAVESERNYHTEPGRSVLMVLDEGDDASLAHTAAVVAEELSSARPADDDLIAHWLSSRNDVAALEALITAGLVVDTMEVTGRWADLAAIYEAGIAAIGGVDGTLAVSAHQSHSYTDGGCLYFTFAGKPEQTTAAKDAYYRTVWDAGTTAVIAAGASLSHHHGVGLNRSRFVTSALGESMVVLRSLKGALDPVGVLNPGKLGLPSGLAPGVADWT